MPSPTRCPYAKSDMTPCYMRDGDIVEVEINGSKACVGCEHSFEWLHKQHNFIAKPNQHSFAGYTLDELEGICKTRRSKRLVYRRAAEASLPFLLAYVRQLRDVESSKPRA